MATKPSILSASHWECERSRRFMGRHWYEFSLVRLRAHISIWLREMASYGNLIWIDCVNLLITAFCNLITNEKPMMLISRYALLPIQFLLSGRSGDGVCQAMAQCSAMLYQSRISIIAMCWNQLRKLKANYNISIINFRIATRAHPSLYGACVCVCVLERKVSSV